MAICQAMCVKCTACHQKPSPLATDLDHETEDDDDGLERERKSAGILPYVNVLHVASPTEASRVLFPCLESSSMGSLTEAHLTLELLPYRLTFPQSCSESVAVANVNACRCIISDLLSALLLLPEVPNAFIPQLLAASSSSLSSALSTSSPPGGLLRNHAKLPSMTAQVRQYSLESVHPGEDRKIPAHYPCYYAACRRPAQGDGK